MRRRDPLPDPPAVGLRPERHRVCPRKAVRVEADAGDVLAVLLQVLADLVGWRDVLYHLGRALGSHHVTAAVVRVEVQPDPGTSAGVLQLLAARLGVDQERLAVPQKPDGYRLRLATQAHRGEPDRRLFPQPPVGARPGLCRGVEHGGSLRYTGSL